MTARKVVDENSPFLHQHCPVSGKEIQLGDTVYVCGQNSVHVYEAESWAQIGGVCLLCNPILTAPLKKRAVSASPEGGVLPDKMLCSLIPGFVGISGFAVIVAILLGCVAISGGLYSILESNRSFLAVATSQRSDAVKSTTEIQVAPPSSLQTSNCEGAYGGRLHPGDSATVVVFQVQIRGSPGLQASKVNVLREGRQGEVTEGPVCVDGLYWVKMTSELGSSGWVAEGEQTNDYLAP